MVKFRLPPTEKIIIYLVVIYVIGIIGILTEATRPLFIFLVPFNIAGAATLILIYHQKFRKEFILSAILIYSGGFIIEWLGIKTGFIFGNYEYGTRLGSKLDGVPLLMGINWLMLIYGASCIMGRISGKKWLISFLGAGLMVIYDLFLERAAIKFNFWKWANGTVPLQNYLAWYISAFVFIHAFLLILKQAPKNPVAEALIWLQLIFFGCIWVFFDR